MANKKPKVVFTYVEAGMGHIMPMSGMQAAFEKKYGDKCEIVKSYIFSESKREEVRKMGTIQSDHTKKAAFGIFYKKLEAFSYTLPSKFVLFFLDRYFGKGRTLFFKDAQELNPDLVVSSYYLPAHLFREANAKGLTKTLIATYTPDPYIYPAWDRKCDVYFVNNSVAEKMAVKRGFKPQTVKRIPFVFKNGFTNTDITKEQASAALGLDNGKFTVLYTSGAYGSKKDEKFLRALIQCPYSINVVVLCGKNAELLNSVKTMSETKHPNVDVFPIGFTDKMKEYIVSADVMIGKSGMNTIMEAAALGCPMIINSQANRLEESICDFAVKEKIVLEESRPEKIIEIIGKSVNGEEQFSEIKDNMLRYRDLSGAEKAADILFGLLKTRFPEL